MAQDQRIYTGECRDIVSSYEDPLKTPIEQQRPTTRARTLLNEALLILAQEGFAMSDIQTFIMRQTVDTTRDMISYGIPKKEKA